MKAQTSSRIVLWGNTPFSVERFRIDGTRNLAKLEKHRRGGKLELSNPRRAPGVELIVLERK